MTYTRPHRDEILAEYKRPGASLRSVAKKFGRSVEGVRQTILSLDPDCMRPRYTGEGPAPHRRGE